MTKLYFPEFPPVSTEAWEQAIREDLKGADYAEKLIWHSPEGIDVKPYYRAEDLAGLKFLDAAPGDFPYVRGTHSSGGWRIREEIDAVDPEEANSAARCAVAAGAEEIAFCASGREQCFRPRHPARKPGRDSRAFLRRYSGHDSPGDREARTGGKAASRVRRPWTGAPILHSRRK